MIHCNTIQYNIIWIKYNISYLSISWIIVIDSVGHDGDDDEEDT